MVADICSAIANPSSNSHCFVSRKEHVTMNYMFRISVWPLIISPCTSLKSVNLYFSTETHLCYYVRFQSHISALALQLTSSCGPADENYLDFHWFRWWLLVSSAPSGYFKQCWLLENKILTNGLQRNLNKNAKIRIKQMDLKMSSANVILQNVFPYAIIMVFTGSQHGLLQSASRGIWGFDTHIDTHTHTHIYIYIYI